ncbi:unnamed protein product [Rotaria sp. Silwood1]|nr:unnamed protein product [Rotaria sp. Silwood1]
MVHNIHENTSKKDIKKIIAKNISLKPTVIDVHFPKPHFIHGKQSQCAIVQLPSSTDVDSIMKVQQTIQFRGTESFISRMIPKDYFLSHQTTTGLLIQIQENRQLSDEKLEAISQYFERYGSINCKEYINGQDIYVIFHNYDAVDQIMLNGEEQMIDGYTVRVQKVRVPTERRM